MPKQSAGTAVRERYKISSAESEQVACNMRAALQILDPSARFNIGDLAERSGYCKLGWNF